MSPNAQGCSYKELVTADTIKGVSFINLPPLPLIKLSCFMLPSQMHTCNSAPTLMSLIGALFPSDSVIRTAYYKYFHPKEALISNGILNRYWSAHRHVMLVIDFVHITLCATGKSTVQQERLSQGHRVIHPIFQCSEFYVVMLSSIPFLQFSLGGGREEEVFSTNS